MLKHYYLVCKDGLSSRLTHKNVAINVIVICVSAIVAFIRFATTVVAILLAAVTIPLLVVEKLGDILKAISNLDTVCYQLLMLLLMNIYIVLIPIVIERISQTIARDSAEEVQDAQKAGEAQDKEATKAGEAQDKEATNTARIKTAIHGIKMGMHNIGIFLGIHISYFGVFLFPIGLIVFRHAFDAVPYTAITGQLNSLFASHQLNSWLASLLANFNIDLPLEVSASGVRNLIIAVSSAIFAIFYAISIFLTSKKYSNGCLKTYFSGFCNFTNRWSNFVALVFYVLQLSCDLFSWQLPNDIYMFLISGNYLLIISLTTNSLSKHFKKAVCAKEDRE